MIQPIFGFLAAICFALAPGRTAVIALRTILVVWGLGVG